MMQRGDATPAEAGVRFRFALRGDAYEMRLT